MAKITTLSLFVINQVKLYRLCLGISSERLSFLIERSHGYVLTIENIKLKSHYPPHEWPKLAEVLSCTVHDLLPDRHSDSTGELVDKTVISLGYQKDLLLVLDGMIAFGFFDVISTIDEVAKHLFFDKPEQLNVLDKALKSLSSTGKLQNVNGSYLNQ